MKIRTLRSTVRVRSKKKRGASQASHEGTAPHLNFAKEHKILETSLDSQRMIEQHLESDPGMAKKSDPHRVADAVYDIMKRELQKDILKAGRG